MRCRRTVLAGGITLLLLTCTSCSVEELDTDGDGLISKSEFLSAAFDALCGNQSEPDARADELPADELPGDELPGDETPAEGI